MLNVSKFRQQLTKLEVLFKQELRNKNISAADECLP